MFHLTKVSCSLCQRAQQLLIKRSFVTGEGRRSPGTRCDVDTVASWCECSGPGAGQGEGRPFMGKPADYSVRVGRIQQQQQRSAAPPTPPRWICVFDVRKSWTSSDGAKGNRNLGLTFCANAGSCYVQKLGREKSHKSLCR